MTFNGNGKVIDGKLIAGKTMVREFEVANNDNDNDIIIPYGASLNIYGEQPFKVGYGKEFIIGDTDNQSTSASLIIPGGILIEGGSGDNFLIYNTKVEIGSIDYNREKEHGKFNFNLINSVATVKGNISLPGSTVLILFNSKLYYGGTYSNSGSAEVYQNSEITKQHTNNY